MFEGDEAYSDLDVSMMLKKIEKKIVRTDILKNKSRIDGRSLTDVRQIDCQVGVLPRAHGSALFTRGETQALVTLTLGTSEDEQRVESLNGLKRNRFMLHYNFPPFSVGETGRIGTGRREIGHGKLAWRALNSSLPEQEKFPYTYRVVSEITESNGSSSMATVCGGSLALMDAGVPMKAPVAGIAMGLIKEGDDFSVLSDILGDEDHLGDMDFKVAGTKDGITSLQMDIKITGITFEIMNQALSQAKDGRIHILGEMAKALTGSRDAVSKYTPKIETVMVDKNERVFKQNDTRLKVTEKEIYFIEQLLVSKKPLSKNFILENIWKYSSETDTHTVETHIYRLRQKIKNHFNDDNFIKYTGKGYSL